MSDKALQMHKEWQGKIEIALRCPMETKEDLSLAYTPGVAMPCLEINKNPSLSYSLTRRGNTVAVITDGTAVLGLGDIGPERCLPVPPHISSHLKPTQFFLPSDQYVLTEPGTLSHRNVLQSHVTRLIFFFSG